MALDIISYEIGKNSGGGSSINNQNKNVTITENGTTTLTADAGYTGLGTVGITTNVSGGGDISEYFDTSIKSGSSYTSGLNGIIKKIPSNLTITGTDASYMFARCTSLTEIPQLDTSNVTNMSQMFNMCTSLTTVPQLNASNVTDMWLMFDNVPNLTYESINNILAMCTSATSYTGTKKLTYIGISMSYYDDREIAKLSNYEAFLNAGWTVR